MYCLTSDFTQKLQNHFQKNFKLTFTLENCSLKYFHEIFYLLENLSFSHNLEQYDLSNGFLCLLKAKGVIWITRCGVHMFTLIVQNTVLSILYYECKHMNAVYIFFRENKALLQIWWGFLLSQISRNFAKNGVKSFAFRENLKTQKYSHSTYNSI